MVDVLGMTLGPLLTGLLLWWIDRLIDKRLNPGRPPLQQQGGFPAFWWVFVWAMALGAVVGTARLGLDQEWARAALFFPLTALLVWASAWAFRCRYLADRA